MLKKIKYLVIAVLYCFCSVLSGFILTIYTYNPEIIFYQLPIPVYLSSALMLIAVGILLQIFVSKTNKILSIFSLCLAIIGISIIGMEITIKGIRDEALINYAIFSLPMLYYWVFGIVLLIVAILLHYHSWRKDSKN